MEARDRLVKAGVVAEGHFVFTSGRHGRRFINKTAGMVRASDSIAFARPIARHFAGIGIEAVAAPELGAIPLMAEVRRELYDLTGREVFGVIVEKVRDANGKPTGEFVIARGQARFIDFLGVAVIEDILNTGETARKSIAAVRKAKGVVRCVAALWNRGGVRAGDLDVPELFSLVDEELESWPEDECPLCKQGVPVNTVLGKGKEFLARKAE